MSKFNHYDKLKTVFIGKMYDSELLLELVDDPKIDKDYLKYLGQVFDETNEDLDNIEKICLNNKVKVYRPDLNKVWNIKKFFKGHQDPFMGIPNMPVNPGAVRDWLFAVNNTLLICQTSLTLRCFEYMFWEEALLDLQNQGKQIYQMPLMLTVEHTLDAWNEFQTEVCNKNDKGQYEFDYEKMFDLYNEDFPYWNKDNDHETELIYLYNYSSIKNIPLFHTASAFLFDDYILSNQTGTPSGKRWFKKAVETAVSDINFIWHTSVGHIDGCSGIINKNIVGSTANIFSKNIPTMNKEILLTKSAESHDDFKTQFQPNAKSIQTYMKNLKGYDQRVDFDYNWLCLEPNKIIAGIFNDEAKKTLEKNNVEIINSPLRHRWVIDGGIHCYTNDIDRENFI